MIALRLVKNLLKLNLNNLNVVSFCNHSTVVLYEQGQKDPEKPKIREYFYYIDHHGMVCLKFDIDLPKLVLFCCFLAFSR